MSDSRVSDVHLAELRRVHALLHGALDALFRDMNPTEAGRLLILVDDRLTALINSATTDGPQARPRPDAPAPPGASAGLARPSNPPPARPEPRQPRPAEPAATGPAIPAAPIPAAPMSAPSIPGRAFEDLAISSVETEAGPPDAAVEAEARGAWNELAADEPDSVAPPETPLFRTDWLGGRSPAPDLAPPASPRTAPVVPSFEDIVREAAREAGAAATPPVREDAAPPLYEPAAIFDPGAAEADESDDAEEGDERAGAPPPPPRAFRFPFPRPFGAREVKTPPAAIQPERLPTAAGPVGDEADATGDPRRDDEDWQDAAREDLSPEDLLGDDAAGRPGDGGLGDAEAPLDPETDDAETSPRTGLASRLFGSLRGALFSRGGGKDEPSAADLASPDAEEADDLIEEDLDDDAIDDDDIADFDDDFEEAPLTADEQIALLHEFADELLADGVLEPAMRQTADRIILRKVDDGIDIAVKGFPTPLGTVRLSEDGEHAIYHPQLGIQRAKRGPNRADLETWLEAMGEVVVQVMADIVARRGGGPSGA